MCVWRVAHCAYISNNYSVDDEVVNHTISRQKTDTKNINDHRKCMLNELDSQRRFNVELTFFYWIADIFGRIRYEFVWISHHKLTHFLLKVFSTIDIEWVEWVLCQNLKCEILRCCLMHWEQLCVRRKWMIILLNYFFHAYNTHIDRQVIYWALL